VNARETAELDTFARLATSFNVTAIALPGMLILRKFHLMIRIAMHKLFATGCKNQCYMVFLSAEEIYTSV
jgi:hypothetical protein